ncbi:MAG: ABC transporter substrate-binding protein [Caldilineaceae bacterium]|nr:ABC transporter substrate-binding protein [Caldilineaceae bacterium]
MSEHTFGNFRRTRREFLRDAAILGGIMVGASYLSACQPPAPSPVTGEIVAVEPAIPGELPRNETLYMAGFQWGPPTTFNPIAAGPITWPAGGQHPHIHETLFGFNLVTGALDPVLGKELAFTDETTAVVTMQPGARWQDGEPLTVEDVLYTFHLAERHEGLPYGTFWDYVSEVTAIDEGTLQFTLNPERLNAGMFKQFMATVRILPQHIWEEREASGEPLTLIVDDDPVGSGPYKVLNFSPERVALARDDNYWGQEIYGLPAPKYVVHPIFKSNDDGNLALQRGEVDLSQQFVPQIWKMWEELNLPVGTWFKGEPYYIPGSIPLLFVNGHKPGLDNPLVRRALAHSINYPQIAATAMSRYSIPVNSSLIIPDGGEARFFSEELVQSYGWEYNPEKAVEILEQELGATKGRDGIYVLPDGARLGPYTVQTPYGWTDWMTAIDLVAQNATDVGIEVRTEFPDAPVVTTRMQQGDFELTLWFVAGAGPASPWLRYRDVLDNRGVPEFGQTAFWNYGRFEHPDVPGLLDMIAASTDEAEQRALFGEIDKIFMENIPAIPLMYRPLEFYEYNESVWAGFPNEDNPVAPPTAGILGTRILSVIRPGE